MEFIKTRGAAAPAGAGQQQPPAKGTAAENPSISKVRQAAFESGYAEGRAAERTRVKAIVAGAPSGFESLAVGIAVQTDLPIEEAKALVAQIATTTAQEQRERAADAAWDAVRKANPGKFVQ